MDKALLFNSKMGYCFHGAMISSVQRIIMFITHPSRIECTSLASLEAKLEYLKN